MVTWKRGFIEIIGEILEILSKGPMKKSHISFRGKLDSRSVTRYLKIMIQSNLIKKSIEDPTYFILTLKGSNYLKNYHELVKILDK